MSKMNKKGQMGLQVMDSQFNLFTLGIVAFLAVVFFAGLMFSMNIINTTMHNAGLNNEQNAGQAGYVNMTKAADDTFGKAYSAMDGLRLVSMSIIFSMILGMVVVSFFQRTHPFLFIVYIFFVVLAVIFSVPISNAYQELLGSTGPLTTYLQMHTMTNFILINLPFFTAAVGMLCCIFLFINIVRTGGEGGL